MLCTLFSDSRVRYLTIPLLSLQNPSRAPQIDPSNPGPSHEPQAPSGFEDDDNGVSVGPMSFSAMQVLIVSFQFGTYDGRFFNRS